MSLAQGTTAVAGDVCPRRPPHLRARPVEGELVVLDRERQLVHQLNQTASYIWQRCDGERTVAAIATELAEVFEVARDVADVDVAQAVRQLAVVGLLELPQRDGR